MVNANVETQDVAENLFFVFVTLNDFDAPEYYVVPKRVVADYARNSHQRWLRSPSRSGQPHVDTPMRKFADPDRKHKDRWDLLGFDPEP